MKLPLQITTRKVSLSEAAAEAIRHKAKKLETFFQNIIACRVMVEVPHRHKTQGMLYNVRLDITVPGGELVVRREPHQDIYVAIRDAFDAARRQLQSYAKKRRGDVKLHNQETVTTNAQSIDDIGPVETETIGVSEVMAWSNVANDLSYSQQEVKIVAS